MKRSSWQGLDTAARTLTPTLLLVALVFLGQLPYSLSGQASVTPYFVLMGVFYWGLHRPDLLPAVVVFLVGQLVIAVISIDRISVGRCIGQLPTLGDQ